MRTDQQSPSALNPAARRLRSRDILRLLLLLLVAGAVLAQGVPPDWVAREHAGIRFRLPPQWEEQNRTADNIIFSDRSDTDQTLMFGTGWEADPAALVEEIRKEGADIEELGERTLMGAKFEAREITGGSSGQPGWIMQYVAKSPRGDGKRLFVQYGVQGRNSPGLLEDLFDQIAASLARTAGEEQSEPAPAHPSEPIPEQSPPTRAKTQAAKKEPTSTPSPKAAAPRPSSPADELPLTPEQQAQRLFDEVVQKDDSDFAGIEAIYRRVMDELPQTPQAEESYWRLANMFLLAFDPPRRADAQALLERYLERYPDSTFLDRKFAMFAKPGLPLVKERLLNLYEEAGQWEKAATIYAGFIPDSKAVAEEQLPFLPGYGKTLEKLGRPADAIACYRAYLARAPDKSDFVARIVQGDLERLEGKSPPAPPPAAPSRPENLPRVSEPAEGSHAPAPPAAPVAAEPPPKPAAEPAPAITPDSLVEEARALQAKGDYPGALTKYRASLALKPDPKVEERVKKLEAYLQTTGKK